MCRNTSTHSAMLGSHCHASIAHVCDLPPLRDLSLQSLPELSFFDVASALRNLSLDTVDTKGTSAGAGFAPTTDADAREPQLSQQQPPPQSQQEPLLSSPAPSTTPLAQQVTTGASALSAASLATASAATEASTLRDIASMQSTVQGLSMVAHAPPPFSYGAITYHAMKSTGRTLVTTHDIYSAIAQQYGFYRTKRDKGWQKTVRSTLSTLPCFEKYPCGHKGRGVAFMWGINEQLARKQIVFTQVKKRKPKRTARSKCGKSTH